MTWQTVIEVGFPLLVGLTAGVIIGLSIYASIEQKILKKLIKDSEADIEHTIEEFRAGQVDQNGAGVGEDLKIQ